MTKLSFGDFLNMHEEDIYCAYMESGTQYELDISYEQFEESEYEAYLENFGQWKDIT